MKTCPHCGRRVGPLQLSLYATTTAYTCTSCKKKSRFDRRLMGAIGSVGLIGAVTAQTVLHLEGLALVALAAAGTVSVITATYCCLTLQPANSR